MSTPHQTAGVVPVIELRDRVLLARRHAGMEQTELADATGLSRRTLSNYERGTVEPRRAGLIAIAFATGVSLEWLETGNTPAGDPGGGGVVRHQGLEPRTDCFGADGAVTSVEWWRDNATRATAAA